MKTGNGRDLTTVKGRLMEFLRTRKISRKEFSEAMGLSLNYVGAIRKSLPAERMRRLMELYPELNRDWLLYGEGEMLNDRDEPSATADGYAVPLLPVEASAGTMSQISQGVMPYECETIMSPVRGVDMAIKVCGDSMEPTFSNGDTLLIRKINDKAFIPWGHPVVIDTENEVPRRPPRGGAGAEPQPGLSAARHPEIDGLRPIQDHREDFPLPVVLTLAWSAEGSSMRNTVPFPSSDSLTKMRPP